VRLSQADCRLLVHNDPPAGRILSQLNPVHTVVLFSRCILILSCHTRFPARSGLFPAGFESSVYFAVLSHTTLLNRLFTVRIVLFVCSVIQAALLLLVFVRCRLIIVVKPSVGKNGPSREADQSPPRSADVKNYWRETKHSVCMLLWRAHEQLFVLP